MWRTFTGLVESLTSSFVNQVLIQGSKESTRRSPVRELQSSEEIERFLEAFAAAPRDFFSSVEPRPVQGPWCHEKRRDGAGILAEFSFASDVPSGLPGNDLVQGIALLHPDRQNSRHIILLHGWITPTHHQSLRFARELLRHGVSTYILELPYHMRRRPPGFFSGTYLMNSDMRVFLQAIQQGVADARKCIRLLREEGVSSIGLSGISLGAHTAGIVSSFEDLDLLALIAPLVDPFHTFSCSEMVSKGRDIFEGTALPQEKLKELLGPLALSEFRPKLPKENILLVNALYDRVVYPEKVRELWRAWAYPQLFEVPHGHVTLFFSWEPFVTLAARMGGAKSFAPTMAKGFVR